MKYALLFFLGVVVGISTFLIHQIKVIDTANAQTTVLNFVDCSSLNAHRNGYTPYCQYTALIGIQKELVKLNERKEKR